MNKVDRLSGSREMLTSERTGLKLPLCQLGDSAAREPL